METAIWIIIAVVTAAIGYFVASMVSKKNAQSRANTIIEEASREGDMIKEKKILKAKEEEMRIISDAEKVAAQKAQKIQTAEARMKQREIQLNQMQGENNRRKKELDNLKINLDNRQQTLDRAAEELEQTQRKAQEELVRISGLSADEAREKLVESLKDEAKTAAAGYINDIMDDAKMTASKEAKRIVIQTIQRVATETAVENSVTVFHIDNDEIKGRIIGREGRNIRSFEQLTGTNLIIDDTPECVTISCFDPVRREIGRVTMENLISDGRIHPARIEEMYEKAVKYVEDRVQKAGEQAAFDTGIHDLHPEVVKTLGRLLYRTSYGQNVLNHSLEVAYLAGVMASELGLDPVPAKRAGLLHDLGKAADHEVDGSHAVIGADLAKRFGESEEIVHAIEAHHEDVDPNSVLDMLIQAADAVSAARPGARKETLDAYIKRLEKMEEIANGHKGVERTFAIQAGREVRVMVKPDVVDDAESVVLAHDIAKQIENEMQYPGQVKVVVVRESRAVDYAK